MATPLPPANGTYSAAISPDNVSDIKQQLASLEDPEVWVHTGNSVTNAGGVEGTGGKQLTHLGNGIGDLGFSRIELTGTWNLANIKSIGIWRKLIVIQSLCNAQQAIPQFASQLEFHSANGYYWVYIDGGGTIGDCSDAVGGDDWVADNASYRLWDKSVFNKVDSAVWAQVTSIVVRQASGASTYTITYDDIHVFKGWAASSAPDNSSGRVPQATQKWSGSGDAESGWSPLPPGTST
jgi:hypothetical protein